MALAIPFFFNPAFSNLALRSKGGEAKRWIFNDKVNEIAALDHVSPV